MKGLTKKIFAIVLFLTGIFSFVACFSYCVTDPSFNTVSTFPIQNKMGAVGAILSDGLFQLVGRFAYAVPVACCVFGVFLWRNTRWLFFRMMMFCCALIGGMWLAGESAAVLAEVGHGGYIGFFLNRLYAAPSGVLLYVGWGAVAAFFVLGLKVPVWFICRWGSQKAADAAAVVHKMPKPRVKKLFGWVKFPHKKVQKRGQKQEQDVPTEDSLLTEEETIEAPKEKTTRKKFFFMGKPKTAQATPRQRIEPSFDFFSERSVSSVGKEPERQTKQVESASEQTAAPVKAVPVSDKKLPSPSKDSLELPSSSLLDAVKASNAPVLSQEAMEKISYSLERILAQFGVEGKVVGAHPGPVVTLYEFLPADGVKASRVISLADDIAMKMSAKSVRMAVIPGTCYIGVEIPNAKRETVYIREMIENVKFQANSGALPLILGKDIGGTPVFADLAKMPHLLVAGTTGSGKSVAINTMVLSLLYRFTPAECRMIMVDPKMVELSVYNRIPHLLTPVVVDPEKAVIALKWAVREMEDRYRSMSQLGVRNIDGYNQKLLQAAKEGRVLTRRVQTGFDPETGRPIYEEQQFDLTPIPYIVIIVDEMADLMGRCGKEVDPLIQRLAQMARAVGIHLVLATQRPSVDVITGTIKSNFPSRMSFQVRSKIDSRTILDEQGAERLLGKGDMLFMPAGSAPQRIHGPFVSDDDVERVVHHWEMQAEPEYLEAVTMDVDSAAGSNGNADAGSAEGGDLYDRAVAIVLRDRKPTTSYIQRQLRIGYNKAADLIDRMELEGVVSKPNMSGKREIIVPMDNA